MNEMERNVNAVPEHTSIAPDTFRGCTNLVLHRSGAEDEPDSEAPANIESTFKYFQ